jgi:transcriptional regulator with PAS, ATPase and Fis domain
MNAASSAAVVWVGVSPASRRVLELAGKTAETDTTLLVTGESGTGKDQLARLIHQLGPRRDAPILKIDCASLPAELVESELFGHERGAFTGAVARKPGRFELAQGGTIVLDEVAALAPALQAKLLRVLEERTFQRLGGSETLRITARLMALTNTDLPQAVVDGRFREDLFFRLNVLSISIPPLRERREDIAPLAAHFLERLGPVHGYSPQAIDPETISSADRSRQAAASQASEEIGFSGGRSFSSDINAGNISGVSAPAARTQIAALNPAAQRLLDSYDWPGNARQLKNAIEHALIFASDKQTPLQPSDFPDIAKAAGNTHIASGGLRSLEEIEREAIRATLEQTRYKIGRAAEILGISRKTLLEKRKKYSLL